MVVIYLPGPSSGRGNASGRKQLQALQFYWHYFYSMEEKVLIIFKKSEEWLTELTGEPESE